MKSVIVYKGQSQLVTLDPTTEEELLIIIKSKKIKCSPDDPWNSSLISENLHVLLPFWVELVNLSLATGSMESLKSAVVIPLLKQADK
eukprot:gene3965-4516_t